ARVADEAHAAAPPIAVGVARARDARGVGGDDPAHRRPVTARVARGAGRPVRGAVVALLLALADAVAADLERAGRRAAVAGGRVAVIAGLARIELAVTAPRWQ